jgi:hypothetical protein
MTTHNTFYKNQSLIICVQTAFTTGDNMLVGSGDSLEEAIENLESVPFNSSDSARDGAEWFCEEYGYNKKYLLKFDVDEDEDEDDEDRYIPLGGYGQHELFMPNDDEWS